MKFRKLIVYSFLLSVLLFSVAAISASDLNGTYDGSGDILKDSNSEGSYSDLSGKIKAENSSFSLEKNYKFNDENDEDYDGILLNKSNFVVNGNNHVIDGNNQARAFKVTGDNVTINNLIINNTVCESGSAILAISNLTLNNVTFINCHPINNPQFSSCGAILAQRVALNINNCKFIDTYGEEGASITAGYSSVNVVNSSFISSSGKLIKGHIYLQGSDMLISNSSFLNTSSRYATAIFAEENGNVIINNTKFKNLAANKTAGAIAVKGIILLAIINCEFDNVSSANNGGAVFADGSKNNHMMETHTLINGTKFTNCSSGFGGAILQLGGNLNIVNSTFSSNSADYEGGAIYTSYADIVILNSKFISNSLSDEISYGGACYLDKGDVMITGSEFINNTGSEVSTLVSYDSELILKSNYFNNPSNVTSIYSVFGNVELDNTNNLTGDRLSLNNTDFLFNFEGSQNHLVLINNSLVFDKMPEKFDLRSYNWTSPVKDQGFMGACWAFGSMAALESALMRYANVTYSLSVNNVQNSMLKFSKYGNEDMAEGGLPFSAVAYLIDWLGVFPEKYEGYDELGKISSLFITPEDIHILNVAIIPIRKNATDNDLIKDALIKYGAVAVS
ncbi:MAG: C1 family peptidase, partial [Methanobrevibacter sp.]|nr:C1 family peptidase [Methanobrevibacter sp.]